MLFNSYIFIFVFFPLVLLGYYGLNHFGQYKLAVCFLTGMSFWFYGYNNIYYLILLVVSILLNYMLTELLSRAKAIQLRRLLLAAGIILNIGILFYFKYYDFFVENLNHTLKTDFALRNLLLPLGISFYTFQQLSYIIDYYKGECEKYSLLDYAAYVSFFPQLIAGPIVYHSELIPQLRDPANKKVDYENLSRGLYAFSLGLAKKVLIADTLSLVVNAGFNSQYVYHMADAVLVMVCYALQIYFDFSGYSDIAYGIGYLFNIRLPVNFDSPYKAGSISGFWDRWHMTLTRFFTKYVYIPLGGSRKGTVRTCLNTMIVFLASGLWHGASWTFILWGALNGAAMLADRFTKRFTGKIPQAVRIFPTFILNVALWSIFRAESWDKVKWLYGCLKKTDTWRIEEKLCAGFNKLMEVRLLTRCGFVALTDTYPEIWIICFVILVYIACVFMKNTQEKVARMKFTWRKMAVTTGLLIWCVMSFTGVSEFLYFNF